MDNKQIRELMTWMEKTSMKKLVLKNQKVELSLEREELSGTSSAEQVNVISSNPMHHELEEHRLSSSPSRQKEGAPAKEKNLDSGPTINSPMVGTFYSASSPDADPFVKEGDTVKEDTVVGIVEAMKVMNEIKARVSGKIVRTLVSNGDPVEFGTPLFQVEE